jgi:hypothetical protein
MFYVFTLFYSDYSGVSDWVVECNPEPSKKLGKVLAIILRQENSIVICRSISRQRPKYAHVTIGYCKKCYLCGPRHAHC